MLKKVFISLLVVMSIFMTFGCSNDSKQPSENPTTSNVHGGYLKIKAVGTDGEVIPDVQFDIKKSDEVVDTITTDNTGTATSISLDLGKYVFVMKSVPDNFIIDEFEYEFNLSQDNQVLEIRLEMEESN